MPSALDYRDAAKREFSWIALLQAGLNRLKVAAGREPVAYPPVRRENFIAGHPSPKRTHLALTKYRAQLVSQIGEVVEGVSADLPENIRRTNDLPRPAGSGDPLPAAAAIFVALLAAWWLTRH